MEDSGQWQGDHDLFDDEEEKQHLYSVLDSFSSYRRLAHYNVTHLRRQQFYQLPREQWDLLAGPPFSFLDTLNKVDDAIDANADIADAILESGLASLGFPPSTTGKAAWEGTTTKLNLDKARSTLHQLYRDWSAEGAVEREPCYGPVLADLAARLSPSSNPRVLIPGAGLGRLVFELARAGYAAEGNELSYHQLLASSFILNHTQSTNQFPLYPFAHAFSNNLSRTDQMMKVMVPDVHPAGCQPMSGSMSMTTGDFTTVYQQEDYQDEFDAIASVFFVDTAPNVMKYIETVRHCLKKGGYWINVGPLLWHFGEADKDKGEGSEPGEEDEDGETEKPKGQDKIGSSGGSIQLTDEEVVKLVETSGFAIELHDANSLATGYVQNPRSMLRSTYHPSHWVARKL